MVKKGFKYFICYKNDDKIRSIFNASKNECIQKKFNETFSIKDCKLQKKTLNLE